MSELTAERLRKLLHFDPKTGRFTRISVPTSCYAYKAGDECGEKFGEGYLRVRLLGGRYQMHRLAWLYMTGDWPTGQIDHINGEKDDNRFSNLRDVTPAANTQNVRLPRSNSRTGYLGVSIHKCGFRASIWAGGRKHSLGIYKTATQAHEAYVIAKRQLHTGCVL